MQYHNIPDELKARASWVVWRYEDVGSKKPTKVPYDAKAGIAGRHANINDADTWTTFDDAVKAAKDYDGIGFVFTSDDPYTFIDLDDTNGDQSALDRQIKIFKEFNSYSEVSPSGTGLHVIIKGTVPHGRKRSSIEIYSSQRYATFTGNVYNNVPIADRQDLIMQLWEQMSSQGPNTTAYTGDDNERSTDDEIFMMARNAVNGDKFFKLFNGNWTDFYPSQSEADFSLINMISFYTQNRNQITRIFRNSALGQRPKAKRNDYMNWMINKSFDRMLPPIDFDGFKIALDNKVSALNAGSSNGRTTLFDGANVGSNPAPVAIKSQIPIPPGLMGEIAQFIYGATPRCVPEIALAGAIGLMGGICGRAYNVSGTGLNQYVLLLAATGTGKEAIATGIDKLMNAIVMQCPTAMGFIGPGEINSGQALIKHLHNVSPCFVSMLGEFGLRLQALSNPNSVGPEVVLKRMILDLYNKSGHGQTFRPSIYSDKEKNIDATQSPAFSILGESVPETFYNNLNEDMISGGLLPRFMLIEYNGERPPLNYNHMNIHPPFALIDKMTSLVASCETLMHSKKVIDVVPNPEADTMLREFDRYADNQINGTRKDILRQLWNRAHIKVLKISALIAVGMNYINPIIMPEHVLWARNMVQNDIRSLSEKFDKGEVGSASSENKQVVDILKATSEYIKLPWHKIETYDVKKPLWEQRIIPYAYLTRRLLATSAFRHDKAGSTAALKRSIQMLLDSDRFREVGKEEMRLKFGTTQRAFVLSDLTVLDREF